MGAWIEICVRVWCSTPLLSHPTMGAWIEMDVTYVDNKTIEVAPHDGCVD